MLDMIRIEQLQPVNVYTRIVYNAKWLFKANNFDVILAALGFPPRLVYSR